jgi:butyrate kinase
MPDESYGLLVVNPGSTTTKVSYFVNEDEKFHEIIKHNVEDLSRFNKSSDQDLYRMEIIIRVLRENNIDLSSIQAVVGRGGLLRPIQGGTYTVNDQMIADLKHGYLGDHPSNCGGLIAYAISKALGCHAYIVDPVVVDEFEPLARISGMPLISRRSVFHALNQKAIARDTALKIGKKYTEINVIIAHMGGGVTVGAHKKGRVIDVNNGLDGDGPFSPERSGSVPVGDLVKTAFSGDYTLSDMKKLINGHGGLIAYMGTHDLRVVEDKVNKGDKDAELIYEAMAYQIAKEIGSCATVLKGDVQAISLTGGLAQSKPFTALIIERVDFIAPVHIFPGEQEMRALALGALRVLQGEEEAKIY